MARTNSRVLTKTVRLLRAAFFHPRPALRYRSDLRVTAALTLGNNELFSIELARCVDRGGNPFAGSAKHPITSTASALKEQGGEAARQVLEHWYDCNKFPSWAAVFRVPNVAKVEEAARGMRHLPREEFRLPWETVGFVSHKTALYGPVSRSYCRSEVGRIRRLLASIESSGFRVDRQSNPIRGYLLHLSDNEYRFVVKGGQHRMALLSSLGYQEVPVAWQPTWPRVIRVQDVDSWPHVEAGHITAEAAATVFHSFFSTISS